MTLKKVESPFLKVVIILVISTLVLVALMYIMHLITYKEGETTLWQNTINYVKPKPFLSKVKKDSNEMIEDYYDFVYLERSDREEEVCSGFYRYGKSLDAENLDIKYNYLDHFCLSDDLLIELKEEGAVFGGGIFSLDKENIFYFVTNAHEIVNEANYSINKLYALNIETGEYKVVFQDLKESMPGDAKFSAYQEFQIIGISGTKLVLSKTTMAGITGDYPCFDVLTTAGENDLYTFHYLELSDENMHLMDYNIPAENILRAKRWDVDCAALLD